MSHVITDVAQSDWDKTLTTQHFPPKITTSPLMNPTTWERPKHSLRVDGMES